MNYNQIEKLKSTMINISKNGSRLRIPSCGISGRIVGVGFKPFWTSPADSKIEKLEINFVDDFGNLVPFRFFNIVDYDVVDREDRGKDKIKSISLDIHVCSFNQTINRETVEKVRLELFPD